MSEYVFRDANGFGCDMGELMDEGGKTIGEYFASNNDDHYGTLHEEIVRCEDCKFFDTRQCKSQWPFRLDGFCAWGERKEEE